METRRGYSKKLSRFAALTLAFAMVLSNVGVGMQTVYAKEPVTQVLDGELTETQTAIYFSNFYRIDCAVPPVNARFCRKPGAVLLTRGLL